MAASSGASPSRPALSSCASSASRTAAWWSACAGSREENKMSLEMEKNQNPSEPGPGVAASSTGQGGTPVLVIPEDALVIVLLLQKDSTNDNPGPEDVYRVGTVAQVLRYVTTPDGGHHLICQGQERFV